MTAEFIFFTSFSLTLLSPIHSTSSLTDLRVLKQMITYPGNVFMWLMLQCKDIGITNNRTDSNTQTTHKALSSRQHTTEHYSALPHSPQYTDGLKAERVVKPLQIALKTSENEI